MNLLFDTNILLAIVRSTDFEGLIRYLNPDDKIVYLSVASEAEIKSIALRNNWSSRRIEKLDNFIEQVNIIDINQQYINSYIEIDTYSQRSNPHFKRYPFRTSRNMGKNAIPARLSFLMWY